MSERPTWDSYFLGIAIAVSKRADCRRRQVGCIIISEDNKIVSTGYNGVRAKAKGCLAGACPRGLLPYDQIAAFTDYNDPNSPGYCISQHAESNALIHAGRDCKNTTVYITDRPCEGCRKLLYNAGVKRIVWPDGEILCDVS